MFRLLIVILCLSLPAGAQQYAPASGFWSSPAFERRVFRTNADGRFLWKQYHLSGVLILKRMPDSTLRAVFQNEMGFPFFDFEWDASGAFRVVTMMDQLNKPAAISLLRKDLEMLTSLLNTTDEGGDALSAILDAAPVPGVRKLGYALLRTMAGPAVLLHPEYLQLYPGDGMVVAVMEKRNARGEKYIYIDNPRAGLTLQLRTMPTPDAA